MPNSDSSDSRHASDNRLAAEDAIRDFQSTCIGALWLGIVSLEQASLTGILCAATAEKHLRLLDALRFARDNARRRGLQGA